MYTMNTIKELAEKFDQTIEQHDIPAVLDAFSEDCEIEILGVHLFGKKGAEKWINWLYSTAPNIKFEPVVIISEGNVFYEEFYVIITLQNGKLIKSHQAETLIFENEKLKILRIFFNPLDFSELVRGGRIGKKMFDFLTKKSVSGLA